MVMRTTNPTAPVTATTSTTATQTTTMTTAPVAGERYSHQRLELGIELALLERRHVDLPAVVLPVAHRPHDLRRVVCGGTAQVHVARLQPGSTLRMLRPDNQHSQQLPVRTAALS